jgi:hypothetical protein
MLCSSKTLMNALIVIQDNDSHSSATSADPRFDRDTAHDTLVMLIRAAARPNLRLRSHRNTSVTEYIGSSERRELSVQNPPRTLIFGP